MQPAATSLRRALRDHALELTFRFRTSRDDALLYGLLRGRRDEGCRRRCGLAFARALVLHLPRSRRGKADELPVVHLFRLAVVRLAWLASPFDGGRALREGARRALRCRGARAHHRVPHCFSMLVPPAVLVRSDHGDRQCGGNSKKSHCHCQDKFDTKGEDKEVSRKGLALLLSHLSHPTLFFTHCGNIMGS